MKKLIYSVFALAGILSVSCSKEVEAPVAPVDEAAKTYTTYTYKATIGDATRTAYGNDKTFSWKAGDKIDVFTYNEAAGYYQISTFDAQEDGVTTTFVGQVEDGYVPGDLAVYPDNAGFIENDAVVYLPSYIIIDGDSENYYTASSSNPLENLVLVGRVNAEGTAYAFKTAMGALKLTFTDLPEGAALLHITAAEKISGYFSIDENDLLTTESAVPGTYTDSEGDERNYSNKNIWYQFTPASDGTVTLYVPMPVGTLSAGTTFIIEDEDENPLFQRSTTKDIVVTRNKVNEIASLSCEVVWTSLGTGLFGDHYQYNDGYEQSVEIQQNANDPTQYRLVDPYAGYRTLIEYEATGEEYGPDPYLNFYVVKKGQPVNGITATHDDLVYFDAYYTGIAHSSYGVDPFLAHPSRWGDPESTWMRSIVVKYQADGVTPANVQLAPYFFWLTDPDAGRGYISSDEYLYKNNVIEIVFPGAERVNLNVDLAYVEISDSTPAQAVAVVDYAAGSAIESSKLVIAANETDALAALADASRYTVASAADSYEVKLPANAPSGDYYIYAQTTVVDGLTAASAQLVVSSSFKYFNSETDLGYTLDDIVGSYSTTDYVYLSNQWQGPATMTMVVEESDDPLYGEIMITSILPEILGLYNGTVFDGALYGSFNTATGEILVPAGQVIAHTNGLEWTVADYPVTKDNVMVLTEPGVILCEAGYNFYAGDYGLQFYTNWPFTFTRDSNSSVKPAPALAPTVGFNKPSFSYQVKKGYRYSPARPAPLAK